MFISKPKCTIFQGWTGPECGDPAITMNDYGGFQCKFHTSLKRYEGNVPGPFKDIEEDSPEELQVAYDLHMQTKAQKVQSGMSGGKITIVPYNAPNSMQRVR